MKKLLLIVALAAFSAHGAFAQSRYWNGISKSDAQAKGIVNDRFTAAEGKVFTLNLGQLKAMLANAPQRLSGAAGVIIEIPNAEGKIEHFRVYEFSNFSPELQEQNPDIRSYVANGVEDPSAYLRFSMSPRRFRSMILRADKKSEFIESYTSDDASYIVYSSQAKHQKGKIPFTCFTAEEEGMINRISSETARNVMASNAVLKTFRLALSVTAEYTAYHGGVDNAVIAMNETMTRVNGVFEKDLAVHLNLIPNNSVLIYTDANTDPYSPATEMNNWNNQLQATLTSVIGEANYDIGHLFGADGGGGNAGCIGCICVNNLKGKGITSPSDGVPEGDTFDIDFVAHEMGHQLGGTHTFSENIEDQGTNVEPGSGSTIMGYAGVANYNVQSNSDDYFVYASIAQIQSNLANKACAVNTPLNNPVMSINAGADYNIPKGTAFILKAVGASANLAGVTYTWEQNDQATNLTTGAASVASASKLTGPTFRSIAPSTNPNRYMPSLDKVLAGTLSTQWESVSNVARTLNFVLTGRDNVAGGGQTKSDAMRVFVKTTSGPFIVTSQSAANTTWTQGSTQTVTWNVAGTTANTINTANVNILLSTDGGQTFTTVLAANTPNDGSETITVPNVAAPFCRIMVEAVGNIYYAVNSTPFSIGYTITTNCETFTNNTPLPVSDGTGTTSIGFGPVAQNTITIPAGAPGTISDVNVTVNATHTYISDLLVGVAHPDQTEIYLWGLNCTNQDGFNVTFNDGSPDIVCANPTNGTFKPYEELAQLNGKTRNGTWTLFAADAAAGDTGQINSWSLSICTQNVVAGVDEAGLTNFSLYPNPNNGNFTVEFTSATGNDINIKMHDMRGRQVYQRSYQNTGLFSGNVVTSGLETGVYLVTVQDGANKVVKRIVVE